MYMYIYGKYDFMPTLIICPESSATDYCVVPRIRLRALFKSGMWQRGYSTNTKEQNLYGTYNIRTAFRP